jgi:hypothetical protein
MLLAAGEEHVAAGDMWLSPASRLLADAPDQADFVYDGGGHRLVLPAGLAESEALPLILIGAGKSMLLRNVRIVNAASLGACLQLGAGAPTCRLLRGQSTPVVPKVHTFFQKRTMPMSLCGF